MKTRNRKWTAMALAVATGLATIAGSTAVFAEDAAPAFVQAETMVDSVTVAANQDITSMNPWVASNSSYNAVMPEVYETLGAYDTFGGEFHGVLMKEWEQVDAKTYRITLFDNIHDSEGNPLKASDVVFSCQKCWEKGELAETAIVDSVSAVDDYTVEFVYKKDCGVGDFEAVMTNIYIVTEAAYNASSDEMVTTPVGTGPYKLAEYVTGSSVTVEATGDYWQSPDNFVVPTQLSNVKTIRCEVIAESSQLATALQTGAIAVSDSIEGESADTFLDSEDYGEYRFDDPNGRTVIANVSEESPLHDINLRKAVFYALDQDAMVAFVNGGNNVPLAVFGSVCYSDYEEKWNETNFPYDLDTAKDYLAQSEYPDGTTLTINVIAGKEADSECALVMQQQLAEIGIDLEINTYQIAQYLPLQGDPTAWDLMVNGFPTYTGYLANAWQKYFDRNTINKDTTTNFLADDDFQKLMEDCVNLDTYGEESYDAFVAYLQDNAIEKGLYAPKKNIIYDSRVIENVVLNQAYYLVPGAFTYVQ